VIGRTVNVFLGWERKISAAVQQASVRNIAGAALQPLATALKLLSGYLKTCIPAKGPMWPACSPLRPDPGA